MKAPYYDTYEEAGPQEIPVDSTHIYRFDLPRGRILMRPFKQTGSHIYFKDLESDQKYKLSKSELNLKLSQGLISALA